MIIDRETFTEMAVHLKLSSDSVLTVARGLALIQNGRADDVAWAAVLDGLMAVNHEISYMERVMRALLDANRAEEGKEPIPSH